MTQQHPFTLRSIYLRESQASMQQGFMPHVQRDLTGIFRITQQDILQGKDILPTGETVDVCTIITCFEFGYINGLTTDPVPLDPEPNFVVSITAKLAADYSTHGQPTEEILKRWASTNAVLHTWPYWREHCQSTQMRMNLPAHPMPLFTLQPSPPSE